jgi:hypothetical protein
MAHEYYKKGSWWVHCQQCAFKRRSEDIRKRWDGLLVCGDTCWEPRHPLDFIKAVPEKSGVPFTSKEEVEMEIPDL